MAVCGVFAFLVLAIKLYKIQIRDHEKYESLAIEQQTRETVVHAARGTVYDRNMNILAASATVETVFISPYEIAEYKQNVDLIAEGLGQILGVSPDSIREKAKDTKSQYKTISVKIEKELADRVREFKNTNSLKGIYIVSDTKRYYPYNGIAAHVVGFVGTDNNGLGGVEAIYEDDLRGVDGRIVTAKNSAGTDMLYTKFEQYYDAENGNDVVLTIDVTAQYYLETALQEAIEDYSILNGAMGIIMDVKTGGIVAMADVPGFDLNNAWEVNEETKEQLAELSGEEYSSALVAAQLEQWRNGTISDTYEPGSTFKIITLAMAIEEGVANENSTYFCGGSTSVLGRKEPLHCWKREGHGSQTLAQAAQHSCNVAFANIGLDIGAAKFYDYIEAFGFFGNTGIDLPGESSGIWWTESVFEDPNNYSQLASAAFGQTFTITPLQLITAVSGIANGGKLMEPYVVDKIVDASGTVVEEHKPTMVRQVVSEETSRKVMEILESVVGTPEGTGKNAYVSGYRIAGKTGTSEKVVKEIETGTKEYMVSFIGVAPADDPQYAVLVVLDNPSRSSGIYISGGVMGAPTVGKIFSDILPYFGVEPEYTEAELAAKDITVPYMKSYNINVAAAELAELGFEVKVSGDGEVVTDQLPMANATVAAGSTVVLFAGGAKETTEVIVPSVTGLTISQARARLESAGLYMSTKGVSENSSTVKAYRQSVPADAAVESGSVIEVTFVESDTSIMEHR